MIPVTGGMSSLKYSPVVVYSQEGNTQKFNSTLKEFDYVKLAPGEFEVLDFVFRCKDSGDYKMKLNLQFTIAGDLYQRDFVSIPRLYCPKSITLWRILALDSDIEIEKVGDFILQDGGYVETP